MKCIDKQVEFSEAAGRNVEVCHRFDGAEPFAGELSGFALAPAGVNPLWGGLAGVGVAGLAATITNAVYFASSDGVKSRFAHQYGVIAGLVGTAVVATPMIIIRKTRVAGYAALGGGLAATLSAYVYWKFVDKTWEEGFNTQGLGLHVAQELQGAPVRILSGQNGMSGGMGGVIAAKQLEGTQPDVEVISGAPFGANFTNLQR